MHLGSAEFRNYRKNIGIYNFYVFRFLSILCAL